MSPAPARRWRRPATLVWALVAAAASALVLANGHLVYVAFASQPDCVAHQKLPGGQPGAYRAAKSAC